MTPVEVTACRGTDAAAAAASTKSTATATAAVTTVSASSLLLLSVAVGGWLISSGAALLPVAVAVAVLVRVAVAVRVASVSRMASVPISTAERGAAAEGAAAITTAAAAVSASTVDTAVDALAVLCFDPLGGPVLGNWLYVLARGRGSRDREGLTVWTVWGSVGGTGVAVAVLPVSESGCCTVRGVLKSF